MDNQKLSAGRDRSKILHMVSFEDSPLLIILLPVADLRLVQGSQLEQQRLIRVIEIGAFHCADILHVERIYFMDGHRNYNIRRDLLHLRLHLGGRSTASRNLSLDSMRWLFVLEVHWRETTFF